MNYRNNIDNNKINYNINRVIIEGKDGRGYVSITGYVSQVMNNTEVDLEIKREDPRRNHRIV